MSTTPNKKLLLTGATGLIGHYLLAELLERGFQVYALLRPPIGPSAERLAAMMAGLSIDLGDWIARERLIPLEGDLENVWPGARGLGIATIVHSAASTRFSADSSGEPTRTNVEGTRRLLEWASSLQVDNLHMVSSAYACGKVSAPVPEAFAEHQHDFHNAYEHSKWKSEGLCRDWAGQVDGRQLTVHRPSVVVGEHAGGRSTKFSGFYLMARATEFLARAFENADSASRHAIPLRIKARAGDCQNIVPVDYVARSMAHIIATSQCHGRVYHLTHPRPPSNAAIKASLERYLDIAGGRFVDPEQFPSAGLNEHEQRFYEISRSIEHYFVDTPTFLRSHTDAVEAVTGMRCPDYDESAIHRLLAYAIAAGWGRRRTSLRADASPCAQYFESFLPAHVGQSNVARLTGVTTTMRFVIEDEPSGEWVCAFDRGQLRTVHRGSNGIRESFGYRSTRDVFWEAISGRTHPQDLFLSGRAEIFGDVEQALKMAMILHAFTQEYPCDETKLVVAGAESE